MSVTIGTKGRAECMVDQTNTAKTAGSGTLDVFATPAMVALMEEAAWKSIASQLAEGESTVGTNLSLSHLSASPVGIRVWAESEVVEVDGKRIVLSVSAFDESGKIGEGTHERFIITNERFLSKAQKKLEQ